MMGLKRKKIVSDASVCDKPFTTPERARRIMGKNFFGREENIRCFAIEPSDTRLAFFDRINCSEDFLKKLRRTHILFADMGFSIYDAMNLRSIRYYNEKVRTSFDKDVVIRGRQPAWWIVRKRILPNSYNMKLNRQMELIQSYEEIPPAGLMLSVIFGYHFATGKKLFKWGAFRTADTLPYLHKTNINIGYFNRRNMNVLMVSCSEFHSTTDLGIVPVIRL